MPQLQTQTDLPQFPSPASPVQDEQAMALLNHLSQALGRQAILHRPGEAEVSFDEAWLVRLARALNSGDTCSATFLLHSRVPTHARRNLVFLLQAITDQFPLD